MQTNRTRHGQKQFRTFMIDAGMDLEQIHLGQSYENSGSLKGVKKLPHKDYPTDQESILKLQRHKKIHKVTKRTEKYKVNSDKTGISDDKLDNQYFMEIHSNTKILNIPHENKKQIEGMQQQLEVEINLTQKKQFLFPLCVNKSNNNFYGYFGHSTVLINEPVIEGGYYMQVNILNPSRPYHPKGKQFESSIRIGICKNDYRLLVPLGGQNSYCYRSKQGSVLHSSNKIESIIGQPYGPGDTIGVYLFMSPPYRYMKQNNIRNIKNSGSRLAFYKNGQISCQLQNINQCFYNVAISLFNWANVNINTGPTFKYDVEVDRKPLNNIFQQKCPYSDLKSS